MSNWKNVNNWHWVNKNCIKWVQKYLDEQLVGLEAERAGSKVSITKVVDCSGDADLNQRKGKMTTIYDIALKLEWKGTLADKTEVTGTLFVPEVAHDTDSDDYIFDITIQEDNNAKQEIKQTIRKDLSPLMIKIFEGLSVAMIKQNSEDVYIESSKLGTATPPRAIHKETSSTTQFGSTTTTTTTASAASSEKKAHVNTTTIHDRIDFQTSAQELYETLMDTQRAMVWTRGPVRLTKEVGSQFELFGGNVTGQILELVPGQKIVQSWRLKSWPAGHFSKVTLTFEQGSDSVDLKVEQTGVPVGEEELTRTNWSGYYWKSIKASFGYGANF